MPSSGGQITGTPGAFTAGGAITGTNLVAAGGFFTATGQFENAAAGCSLWITTGVPGVGLGANGDYALNQAGAAALTHLYQKVAGVWTGLL